MSLKFKLISFLFPRRVVKPDIGAANTPSAISKSKGSLIKQITGNSKDGVAANIQSTTTTIVKDPVSVIGLIESYEMGLAGMQEIAADIQEIIHSIDNVLQELEAH